MIILENESLGSESGREGVESLSAALVCPGRKEKQLARMIRASI